MSSRQVENLDPSSSFFSFLFFFFLSDGSTGLEKKRVSR